MEFLWSLNRLLFIKKYRIFFIIIDTPRRLISLINFTSLHLVDSSVLIVRFFHTSRFNLSGHCWTACCSRSVEIIYSSCVPSAPFETEPQLSRVMGQTSRYLKIYQLSFVDEIMNIFAVASYLWNIHWKNHWNKHFWKEKKWRTLM